MISQLARRAAFGRNSKDIPVAIPLAREGDPLAVRRKERVSIHLQVRSKRSSSATFDRRYPNIAAIDKSQFLAVGAQRRHSRPDDWFLSGRAQLGAQMLGTYDQKEGRKTGLQYYPFHNKAAAITSRSDCLITLGRNEIHRQLCKH